MILIRCSSCFALTPGAPDTIREAIVLAQNGETVHRELSLNRPENENVIFDFSIAPVTGDITGAARTRQAFSHDNERASPGYYAVQIGSPPISVELAATQRTGLGKFSFPATSKANIVINTSSSQAGVLSSSFQVVGPDEVARVGVGGEGRAVLAAMRDSDL